MVSDINKIVNDIIDLQKKELYSEFNLKKYITDRVCNNYNEKDVDQMTDDIHEIIDSLGEVKWIDELNEEIIRKHCDKLDINFDDIYSIFTSIFEDKYLTSNSKFLAKIKDRLNELTKHVKGVKLLKILRKCFYPKRSINYERIGYLYNYIFNDSYIYTTQKIDPTCEHVIPKKIFKSKMPMVSDMHHIFLTPSNINNTRDRLKFNIINENGLYINEKGLTKKSKYVNKYNDNAFEPEEHSKGRIARACAYFFTIYPEYIYHMNNIIDIDIMKSWCKEKKPNRNEVKRNNFIFQIQHTLNPFIIFPELINNVFDSQINNNIEKNKYKTLLQDSINKLCNNIPEIDEYLLKYNSTLEDTEEIIENSYLIIQLEKLKSSIKNISDNLK